ncbi:hypothetical protein H6G81_09345 [Scytonema hofmannii FACHB-248]|uniref:Uncharacterized protein n=1 Tax=Scytonema hofmannii FACHB-248 TaxID=1842502 RepID=A0ABR8GMT3_9CYAN|nr:MULTISPECIES: hypothetical protein [Nostocales]MBD2604729.1 hypothetical protein [Scytonema hofmannii FACHB-248]
MTSRAEEIQKLIADIDDLFAKSGKRLPRVLSGQAAQEPRQVLERIRDFLSKLRESESENKLAEPPQLSPLLAKFADQGNSESSPQPNQIQQQSVQIPQGQKIDFSALLQPLQGELQALLQERATLVQEIRQLEQRRLHNYSLTQQIANQEQMISEFLQVLMNRIVPITPQIKDNLASGTSQHLDTNYSTELESASTPPFLESTQVEQITRFAAELDRRLLSLDGTVNIVFEALQRNIHTYHDSLSQALARMHSQGVQTEHLMSNFVNNLTSGLQQSSLRGENETSSSPTIIQEEIPATKDLDPVIFGVDEPNSLVTANPPTTTASQPNTQLVVDEVDQLYASLFGTENLTEQSRKIDTNRDSDITDKLSITASRPLSISNIVQPPESGTKFQPEIIRDEATPEIINQETNVTDDASALTTSPAESVTNEVQQLDSPIVALYPWLQELNADLVDASNPTSAISDTSEILIFDNNTDVSLPQVQELTVLGDASNPTSAISDTSEILIFDNDTDVSLPQAEDLTVVPVEEPTITDTITVLGDLLISVAPDTSEIQNSEIMPKDEEPQRPNYISASPQENLLSQAEAIADSVFDISLDEDQLEQLNQDLADFDRQLNSESQPEINLENQFITENTLTAAESVVEVLEFFPASSEKTKPTDEASSGSTNQAESFNLDGSVWYLGIDLGTTGISAALLNRSTNVVYPLYWSAEKQSAATSLKPSFRLPAEVYLPAASVSGSSMSTEALHSFAPVAVASEKVSDLATSDSPEAQTNSVYSAQLKPYLQIAIAYKNEQDKWEPVLQLNEFSAGPLIWIVRSLSKLLLTLKCDRTSTTPGLTAAAVGIDEQSFQTIINNIAGVICTCPSNWSEQYRFNVREALLTSKIVQHPQQVFFVEEAIASLLSELDGANGETVQFSVPEGSPPPIQSDRRPIGSTLTINIGATSTEMALVDLPENLQELTHSNFMLHGFAYAGKGIEQDIICQLLFPQKWRQLRQQTEGDSKTTNSNPLHWQPAIPDLDQMHLSSLNLEELELPRPGEPDITTRIRLQQRLESSLLGQAVLDAGLALKLILQHQESFTLELADQRWVLHRRDLEAQVFVPFVRRLNRELNRLLVAKGIPTEAINQAILTGGVANCSAVKSWLRQKLPNAKIIQDLSTTDGAATCSRVAYGLAMLPLHPQVVEVAKQQYTDYFLFSELLRLMPERSLSFNEVIQLFENQGINTRACQQRLLAFLEGELPPGLIPSGQDSNWLTQTSKENPDYKAIAAEPLFDKQGSLSYRPNSRQLQALRRYLDAIKASNQQSFEEPYTVNFVLVRN